MNREHSKASGTQSIQRAFCVLRAIAASNRTGARLVDLATSLGLEQPTVHRILKSLVADHLVLQEPGSRRYFLGRALYELGLAAAHRFSLRDLCQASLNRIAEQTGDTVFLTGRNGNDAVCLDRKDGEFPIKIYSFTPGERRPLGVGAGGRAILSALPDSDAGHIADLNSPRLPSYDGLTVKRLTSLVRADRKLGYTLHDVPGASGVKAVGMAIRDQSGEPVAALSVSGIASRISGERMPQLVTLLRRETGNIERLLAAQSGAPAPVDAAHDRRRAPPAVRPNSG